MAKPAGHVFSDGSDGVVVKISESSVALKLLKVKLLAVPVGLLNWLRMFTFWKHFFGNIFSKRIVKS